MSVRKLLNLLGAWALLTVSHVSAQDYELDVTMGEHGIPTEIFYADEHMSFRLTPDIQRICVDKKKERVTKKCTDKTEERWVATTATVELIVDEEFHPGTGLSNQVRVQLFGQGFPTGTTWGPRVEHINLKTPHHLIVTEFPLWSGTCNLAIRHFTQIPGEGTWNLWRMWAVGDELELAKAFDLLPKNGGCVAKVNYARKKEEERQAREDRYASVKEANAHNEDILLLTNQRLLQCAFDPVCEGKINAGVDRCKKTVQGNYVESCIRDINVSP